MEIKLLNRNEIDVNKWDTRVALSSNGLPYALSSYLDLVTDSNWSALVKGDYVSIFPLPFEMKMGLKMYLQPPFTQQLGLISEDNSIELLSEFLDAIPRDFAMLFLKGNECNRISNLNEVVVRQRSNYVLDLNRDYEFIFSNFSKSLRKRIRKSKDYYEVIESTDVDMLVDYYQNELQSIVGLNEDQFIKARRLFDYLLISGFGHIYTASCENEIDGVLLVLQYQNRMINLFGVSNSSGRQHFAMHLILNHLIEQNANRNIIFDFEGSDIKGVKEFYKSFGPERKVYPELYIDNSPLWLTLVQKVKQFIYFNK